MMEWRWIRDIEKFKAIMVEWDAAVARSSSATVFHLSAFIISWWRHFGEGKGLDVLVCTKDGAIVGGLPLYSVRASIWRGLSRVMSYIGGGAANYTEPFSTDPSEDFLSTLIAALTSKKGWDALVLTDLRKGSALVTGYLAHPPDTILSRMIQDHENYAIDLSSGLDAYTATLSTKLKKDLRSKRRHLEKEKGPLALLGVSGPDDVRRLFGQYNAFSTQSFARRGRRSAFSQKRYTAFFGDLMVALDALGMLDAYRLVAGSETVAVIFAYRLGRGFNWALTSFDPQAAYFRPGYLLIEELLKEIKQRGETFCNCYGHGSFYKAQWCNAADPLYRLVIFNATARGLLARCLFRAEEWARSQKGLVKIARRARGA